MEPLQQPEGELRPTEGEFHHFQLIGQDGQVPLSISLLVHVNRATATGSIADSQPIEADDVIAFHDAIRSFDGNFIKAFQKK